MEEAQIAASRYRKSRLRTAVMKRLMKPMVVLLTILMGMGLPLLEPMSNSTVIGYEGRAGVNTNGLIQQLQLVTNGGVTVSTDTDTGKVLFIGTELSSPIPQPASLSPGASADEAARGFLSAYGQLFGVTDQASQLVAAKTSETKDGRSFVRFQQVYQDVPVMGGELVVQLSSQGRDIISGNGEIATTMSVDTTATVSSSDAKATALGVVSKEYGYAATALRAGEPQLWIYNPSILGMNQDRSSLVWRMDVESTSGLPVRELVLVDAHLGFVALHFNQMDTAKDRQVYNTNCTSTLPGSLERGEGETTPTGNPDVDDAYDYTGYTYDFYWTYHGRDSIDDAGMPIISTVNYDEDGVGCNYQNAFWDGSQMVFGTGFASACDVVAHELTHGVTQYESNLFYYMQSGAINEAFSDIWGEFVELTYNPGSSADRWLLGEDLPIGAIRDMQNPPAYGDPDKMTSTNYACGNYWSDGGGVHTNSGVANKAAYLMVDGDTFNGHVVTGMGIHKTADLFYEVQTHLLTSGSDYADLYDALQQAAINLGYSDTDRETVQEAIDATEMDQQPTSCPTTEAPILESGTPYTLFSDNLENPSSGNWVSGSLSGSDEWYYPGEDNPYGISAYATSGQYNFWGYDYSGVADYYMAMTFDVTLPAGSQPYLHFKHAYDFESPNYDGGVVEYSTNGGSSWQGAGDLFTHNGYTGTVSNSYSNPLGGHSAFVGYSSGYISSRLDLVSLAGQSVRFRFRIGTDVLIDALGWFIDDILIYMAPLQVTVSVSTSGLVSDSPARVDYVQAGEPKTATTYGTWSDNVDYNSTVSIDNAVYVSSTERYGTNAATSWTETETATHSVPYYQQIKPTVAAVAVGTGHTDLGITNSATLTYTRFGAAGTSDVFDAQSFSDWVDIGSTASLSSTSSASTAAHRWYSSGTTSWTVTDATSRSATYWEQFKPTISAVTAGTGHTDLAATNYATLTYTRFGSAGTSSIFDAQGFSDWVDTGSIASLSNPSSASTPTHRWYSPENTSWAVTDASSRSATYWDQFNPAISVVTAGTGHTDLDSTNYVTLSYDGFGTAVTFNVFDTQSFSDWVDTGSTASLSDASSASTAPHRWYSSGTTSWAVTDAISGTATYWDQFKVTVAPTGLDASHPATINVVQGGTTGTSTVSATWSDWADVSSTLSITNPVVVSPTERYSTADPVSWEVNAALTAAPVFTHQFLATIATTGINSSHPTAVTFVQYEATNSLTVSDQWSDWVDAGSTLSIARSAEGGWIGDWSAQNTTTWVADSEIAATVNYSRSYIGVYVLVAALIGAAMACVIITILLLRRRRVVS